MTGINLKGLNITSTIVPTNSADTFATHDSIYGKGGWREVNTIAERDAIPEDRRREGMVVYVRETFRNYQLQSTLSNAGWTVFPATTDVADIINDAINKGQINIDLTAYYNKGEMDALLNEYTKREEVSNALATATENIQAWVLGQGFLTEHQPLTEYAKTADVNALLENYLLRSEFTQFAEKAVTVDNLETTLVDYVTKAELATEMENVVKYAEFTYNDQQRKTIQLANYDSISGLDTTGNGANLIMMSKWDKVDIGSANYPINLNTNDVVTINDDKIVATVDQIPNVEGFVTNEVLNTTLGGYVTNEVLNNTLGGYVTNEVMNNTLGDYLTKIEAEETYLKKVDAEEIYATNEYVNGELEILTDNYNILRDNVSLIAGSYVSKEEIEGFVKEETLDEKVSELGYVKEDDITTALEPYATTEEVDGKLTGYVSNETLNTTLGGYVNNETFNNALGNCVTNETLNTTLGGYVNNETFNNTLGNYVTNDSLTVSLEDYLRKDDLSGGVGDLVTNETLAQTLVNYVTNEGLNTTLGDYATRIELQTVAGNAATKAELQTALGNYVAKADLSTTLANYPTKEDLTTSLADYATRLELQIVAGNAVTNTSLQATLSNYITNAALADTLADYLTLSDVSTMLESYVTQVDLQDAIKDLITVSDLQGYATEAWVQDYLENAGYLTSADLTNYSTRTWVEKYIDTYVDRNGLVNVRDLQGYATEAWVQDYVTMNGGGGSSEPVDLSEYQKKRDAYLETEDITIVGAINEVNAKVDNLIEQTGDLDLTKYQMKEDEGLVTTDKTIVGAINELANKTVDAYTKAEMDEKLTAVDEQIAGVNTEIETINTALAEKADKSEITNIDEQLTAVNDALALKADKETVDSEIATINEQLELKADKSELTNVVKYLDFTYGDQQRKTIQLANYDSISGVGTDGIGYNLAMISKWDKADFGAAGITMNLNTKDVVTINDDKVIATVDDIQAAIAEIPEVDLSEYAKLTDIANMVEYKEFTYESQTRDASVRKTIELANYDTISGLDTKGAGHNLAMVSKWDIADFGAPALHMNLNTLDNITINDEKILATTEDIQNAIAEIPEVDLSEYAKLTDIPDISGLATKEEVTAVANDVATNAGNITANTESITALTENLTGLETELDALNDAAVKYSEFIYSDAVRKTIQLANYDSLSGIGTDGQGYNLAMVSKWDKADFGSPGLTMNLNTKDVVTINDDKVIATTDDIINPVIARIPVRTIRDQLYDKETILGWFGAADDIELKKFISGDRPIFVKWGLSLSYNPHYYKFPVEYAAYESATQVKLVFQGLDTSDDSIVKYQIIMNLDGKLFEGTNSNVQVLLLPIESEAGVTDYADLTGKPQINSVELTGNFIATAETLPLSVEDTTSIMEALNAKANAADVYTKEEIDTKISTVYKYCGSVATVEELPAENQSVGDVYNVEADGINYAWDGTKWDSLAGVVDLSGYTTKEEFEALDNIAVKYSLYDNRKFIQLANHDSISGIMTNGDAGNLIMMSKWDKVDVGTSKVPCNLNAVDGVVTINDDKVVATTEDVQNAVSEIDLTPYAVKEQADKDYAHADTLVSGIVTSVFGQYYYNPYNVQVAYNVATKHGTTGDEVEYIEEPAENHNFVIDGATTENAGVMSAADKTKLDSITVENIASKEDLEAKANVEHGHEIADVTGLQDTLDAKATKEELAAKADAADIPTELPNPNALKFVYNGVEAVAYDGSQEATATLNVYADTVAMSEDNEKTIDERITEVEEKIVIPTFVNAPVRTLQDRVYTQEEILGWFGCETIPEVKQLIARNIPMFAKYGISLSTNPHYYKFPIEYCAFESATQIKMVFQGLDTSNDQVVKYTIIANLNGTIISGNSNVSRTMVPIENPDIDLSNYVTKEEYNTKVASLEAAIQALQEEIQAMKSTIQAPQYLIVGEDSNTQTTNNEGKS